MTKEQKPKQTKTVRFEIRFTPSTYNRITMLAGIYANGNLTDWLTHGGLNAPRTFLSEKSSVAKHVQASSFTFSKLVQAGNDQIDKQTGKKKTRSIKKRASKKSKSKGLRYWKAKPHESRKRHLVQRRTST